jgi:hypothetical protein
VRRGLLKYGGGNLRRAYPAALRSATSGGGSGADHSGHDLLDGFVKLTREQEQTRFLSLNDAFLKNSKRMWGKIHVCYQFNRMKEEI